MVRWVIGSIPRGGPIEPYLFTASASLLDPLSYFSFQPVLHDWCNKALVCAILSVGWCI